MQRPDPGDILRRDRSNGASVPQQFTSEARDLVRKNLARIVPGISDAETRSWARRKPQSPARASRASRLHGI